LQPRSRNSAGSLPTYLIGHILEGRATTLELGNCHRQLLSGCAHFDCWGAALTGCTEALLLAQGFTVPFLASLVRDRLVTAELNGARVVWVQMTDLGREVLTR
jgi:hypothetical protein